MVRSVSTGRRDRLVQQKRHDAYQGSGKWPEPTACVVCACVYQNGRWAWKECPDEAQRIICPACQRAADKFPAGVIEISGPFHAKNRGELLNLVRNEGENERRERPMERIMEIVETPEQTVVTTTGVHVARRIGEALARAYQGEFNFRYGDADKTIRVSWSR
ncbi:MAG: BCAM0308 family protein [Thermodesulfobacteriota bacterium]